MATLAVLLLTMAARAGDGPWTLNAGENNLYVGANYYRYSELHAGSPDTLDLASPLTASGLVGVWTLGMGEGVEGELIVPFESVRANQPGSELCTSVTRPVDWCDPTAGIGDIMGSVKFRVLNELYLSPVSVSVSAGMRSGEAYAGKRGRLTTLGDGQSDVGGAVAVGRTDVLPFGWYRVGLTSWYWHRFANDIEQGQKVPADEIYTSFDAIVSPHPRFALGPSLAGFTRLGGFDFDPDMDFFNPDQWNRLNATQIQAGGKLGIFSPKGPVISIAVLRTIYARNNPSDTLAISVGVGWFFDDDPPPGDA